MQTLKQRLWSDWADAGGAQYAGYISFARNTKPWSLSHGELGLETNSPAVATLLSVEIYVSP